MRDIVGALDDALAAGGSAALAMVVGRRGSLPMAHRAKMAVLADGRMLGTIGGGCLEAEVYAIARRLIEAGGGSVDTFHLTEVEEGLGGHVCGGTVTVLTRGLCPDPATREVVSGLRRLVESGGRAVLAAPMGSAGEPGWALIGDQGLLAGAAIPERIVTAAVRCLGGGTAQRLDGPAGEPAYFLEPVEPTPTAVVFGAGHCGRAIARVAALAGFRVLLYDDRPAFVRPQEHPWVDEVSTLDYDTVRAEAFGRDEYLVIVTRGHEHDLTLLRRLLPAGVAYLGMIGSRRKRLLFERTLREEGATDEQLAALRSPMGLDIGADTPEEIAVAVVAEMIAARRNAHGGA